MTTTTSLPAAHSQWREDTALSLYYVWQGLDKTETVKRHGPEMVHVWRRSYDIPPPPLDKGR